MPGEAAQGRRLASLTNRRTDRGRGTSVPPHTRAGRQPLSGTVLCPPFLRTHGELPPSQSSHRGRFLGFQRRLDAGVAWDTAPDLSPHVLPEQHMREPGGSSVSKDHGRMMLAHGHPWESPPTCKTEGREGWGGDLPWDPGHVFLSE